MGAFMEMSTIGRAVLLTSFATAAPVHADEHCFEVNQNNSAQYDIQELIYQVSFSSRPDITIHEEEGYSFEPKLSYKENYDLLNDDTFAETAITPNVIADEKNTALDVADIVTRVRQVFGLNAVQMSQAVRISRPTLYNHLKGNDCEQSLARYQELYRLANTVNKQLDTDIRKGLKSVLVDGKTLLSYLKEEKLDHSKILEVSTLIANKLANQPNSAKEGMSAKDQIRSSRSISNFG
jgi:hypothetical protein